MSSKKPLTLVAGALALPQCARGLHQQLDAGGVGGPRACVHATTARTRASAPRRLLLLAQRACGAACAAGPSSVARRGRAPDLRLGGVWCGGAPDRHELRWPALGAAWPRAPRCLRVAVASEELTGQLSTAECEARVAVTRQKKSGAGAERLVFHRFPKAFNQLEATEIPKAVRTPISVCVPNVEVSPLWRLTRLQLNDNPLAWGPTPAPKHVGHLSTMLQNTVTSPYVKVTSICFQLISCVFKV